MSSHAESLEDAVLAEINFARTQPQRYAEELEREAEENNTIAGMRIDDRAALSEAIAFLRRQAPLPALRVDHRIAEAADGHVRRQGPRGDVGHGGAGDDGLSQRLQRQGVWAGLVAETISYGHDNPFGVVSQLIIDSGVPGRGHRKTIFGQALRAAGAACGGHRVYGAMCVIDFAGALVER